MVEERKERVDSKDQTTFNCVRMLVVGDSGPDRLYHPSVVSQIGEYIDAQPLKDLDGLYDGFGEREKVPMIASVL